MVFFRERQDGRAGTEAKHLYGTFGIKFEPNLWVVHETGRPH